MNFNTKKYVSALIVLKKKSLLIVIIIQPSPLVLVWPGFSSTYPVMHGWTKTLRIINYLLAVPKLLKHKLHLIPDKDCAVCIRLEIILGILQIVRKKRRHICSGMKPSSSRKV